MTCRWPKRAAAAPPTACVNGSGDLGDTYYPGIGNGGYDVTHYDLNIGYNPTTHILNGKATITAAATQNLCRFNLDLRGLTVDSVKVDGAAATFTRDGRELMITPADAARRLARLQRRGRLPRRARARPARPGQLHRRLELHRERVLHVDPAAGRRHLVPVQQQHQRQGDLYVQCDGPERSSGDVERPADLQHGRRGGGHVELGVGGDRADGDLPGDAEHRQVHDPARHDRVRHPDHQRHPPGPAHRHRAHPPGGHRQHHRLLRDEVRQVPVQLGRRDRRRDQRRLPDGDPDAAGVHRPPTASARSPTSSPTNGSATTSPCAGCATCG